MNDSCDQKKFKQIPTEAKLTLCAAAARARSCTVLKHVFNYECLRERNACVRVYARARTLYVHMRFEHVNLKEIAKNT